MGKRKAGSQRRQQQEENRPYGQRRSHKNHLNNESKTIDFNQPKPSKKPVELIPKSANQEKYIIALTDPAIDIVTVFGPAGTGKTYLSTLAAIRALRTGVVERIVLCRPAISIEGENHGFLPGDLVSKLAPWVRPITDVLREFYNKKEIEYMISEEIIEFAPLGFIRGRTFKNTFLILDEAQNALPIQIKSLLTRIGNGSKFVIDGDTDQTDRKYSDNGLIDLHSRLKATPIKGVSCCEFSTKDIQRHHLIGDLLRLYN